uniref:Uncharacterized protein n=1 Tax=Salix viminalis TaxID=40686 RepID=A0A6N2MLR6_SALVM
MGSVAPPKAYPGCFCKKTRSVEHHRGFTRPRILFCQQQDDDNKPQHQIARSTKEQRVSSGWCHFQSQVSSLFSLSL